MRRLATAVGSALVIAFGATGVAGASLPSHVAANIAGITQFQYKRFSPAQVDEHEYPACNRVCRLLWKDELQLNPASSGSQELWREMYVLGINDHLFKGFPDYGPSLGDRSLGDGAIFEENVLGDAPSRTNDPPQRHLGVQIPSGSGRGSTSHMVMPRAVIASGGAEDVQLKAPTLGWVVDETTEWFGGCHGPNTLLGAPSSQFSLISGIASCLVWVGNDLVPVPDLIVNTWFAPAQFDGPPSLSPRSYGDTAVHHVTVVDPGFATAETATRNLLDNDTDGDYSELIAWLDLALGGDGHFAPSAEALYGGHNPAAGNLAHACAGDPVDCATGNFYDTFQDTRVAGPGVNLSQSRTYNSQDATSATAPGPFGYGWSAAFRDRLEHLVGSDDVIVHQENGSQVRFDKDPEDGSYSADDYVQATLTEETDGTYTYKLPSQLTLTFSAPGRLLQEVDRNGNATTMSYDDGNLATVTDPVGRHLTFTYNLDDTVATATDPAGQIVHYDYDGGDLTAVIDVGGATTELVYDSHHQLTSITDPRGHTAVTNVYDSAHRVTSQTDAQSHETTWAYDDGTTTITDPSGGVTEEEFENNLPTTIVRAQGTPSQSTTRYGYDESYNLDSVVDGNGKEWQSAYDSHGNRVRTTDPLDRTTVYTYDSKHRVTSELKPGGTKINLSYDTGGNLTAYIEQTDPWHQLKNLSYSYDTRGLMTAKFESAYAGSRYWEYGYDSHGNQTSVRSAAGHTSTATYDDNGFSLTSTTPRGKTTTTARNAYELPTTVTDPLGKVTTHQYDEDLNPVTVIDRDGHHTTTTYDALNRPVNVHRADGTDWATSYTAGGDVASRTDGAGESTSYTYDHQHRLHTVTDPLSHVSTLGYDDVGNRTSLEDPGHHVTSYGHDDAGELTAIHYSSSTTHDVSYTYNGDGLRVSMVDGTGTTTYGRDALDRLTSQTTGAGQTTTYHYDDWDRVTSIDYPDALGAVTVGSGGSPAHVTTGTVTRSYDKDDNLTSVGDWLGNSTSFSYDVDGELTHVTRPNGVDAALTYDDGGTLATIADNGPTTTLGRSDEHLLTSTDDGTVSSAYGYDAAQRLVSAPSRSYGYDDADNLTETATPSGTAVGQHFDDANELTSRVQATTTLATFGYDAEGRRTSETPTTGTATALTWSQADDLLSYDGPDRSGGSTGTVDEEYSYDGDGIRQTTTSDGQRLHQAYDLAGGLPLIITDGPTAYVTGPGGLPLEQIASDGTVRWFHQDQLGSTTSQYLRARFYDPATGQFLSRDPLESSTLQPYAYAGNNPTNATDPAGLSAFSAISDTAAGVLDGATGGLSTRLAASALDFNVACAHFGHGFAAGQLVGMVAGFADGEGEAALAAKAGEGGLTWAEESGMLREAATGVGSHGLGSATSAEADALGRDFVRGGYMIASDGKTLVSADRMRQYRPPTFKPNLGRYQANFERKLEGQTSRRWQGNGHLDISDLP